MKKLLIVLLPLLVLTGCGSNEKDDGEKVCKYENSLAKMENTFYYSKDKVLKQVEVTDMKLTQYMKDNLEKVKKDYTEKFADVKGVKVEVTTTEDTMKITATIDYEKADFKQLYEYGLISDQKVKSISLEKTLKGFEENGYTCE